MSTTSQPAGPTSQPGYLAGTGGQSYSGPPLPALYNIYLAAKHTGETFVSNLTQPVANAMAALATPPASPTVINLNAGPDHDEDQDVSYMT